MQLPTEGPPATRPAFGSGFALPTHPQASVRQVLAAPERASVLPPLPTAGGLQGRVWGLSLPLPPSFPQQYINTCTLLSMQWAASVSGGGAPGSLYEAQVSQSHAGEWGGAGRGFFLSSRGGGRRRGFNRKGDCGAAGAVSDSFERLPASL